MYVDTPSLTLKLPLEKKKKFLFAVILDGNSVNMGYDEITKFIDATPRGRGRRDTL